jgi:hypothetical protein
MKIDIDTQLLHNLIHRQEQIESTFQILDSLIRSQNSDLIHIEHLTNNPKGDENDKRIGVA